MRLVRNTTTNGQCKYALVRLDKLRKLDGGSNNDCYHQALRVLESGGFLEYGEKGSKEEFFAIKLQDYNAYPALAAYAKAVAPTDIEFANDVTDLALRAFNHHGKKRPD